ncbi:ADP-ribosylglycohydrolase family protein [Paenibacillus chondroitinus]|uniref:ADP-ribosylglycohydrolase family protein n=1 Tax=Paenibacillus chondroitinus TaxID=59842 RepID=A0ABU6DHG9_9BACL|nr:MULTISPECIES: ADP-ribosylglycohydrolase family protein [Paenibacillus]MCY9658488.1 ADP-ribosylglycohydrolase family protein [Paenibacillus anseongense]MEB4797200.1 ADP-ribosylglycohydrolase family protein [Paenibacillus chondroitinus]
MHSQNKVQTIDKYMGSMLGAMIGDALGWVYEDRGMNTNKKDFIQKNFISWNRKSGGRYQPHQEEISAGSYSDDTQLIFATARSLGYKNWFSHFVKVELPAWLVYERGGGGATKRAADTWSSGNPPWKVDKQNLDDVKRYFEAGGNGVTMRIMPHVFFCRGRIEELTNQVFLNGIATHGHPRALLSAIVYAWALHYLVEKESSLDYGELIAYLIENKIRWSQFPKVNNIKEWQDTAFNITNGQYMKTWEETANEIVVGLELSQKAVKRGLLDSKMDTLTKLNCFDKKTRGAGTVATLVAIYMASKYAADPSAAIMDLASMDNADTDTNASMAGALLGAIHGTEWIQPEWFLVQDYSYARTLVNNMGKTIYEDVNERLWHWSDNKKFKEKITNLKNEKEEFSFGPFSSLKLIEKINNKSSTNKIDVNTYKFSSVEGQTFYVKVIKKIDVNHEFKADKPIVNVKQNAEEIFINLNGKDFEYLSKILPPRVTVSTVFNIFSEILKEESVSSDVTSSDLNLMVTKYVSKSLGEKSVQDLVAFIKSKMK